ncbi:hypothetical protein [Streptacidiphilus sp. MAP5-3]|uniref:hypothetical protein n=1 Tax=unclassified Streptacidiphilus TaxID=2643834 RepID=UPI003514B2C4
MGAILTRQLLEEHEFLSQPVVLVLSKVGNDGELRLAQRQISATSPAWSTIGVLHDLVGEIAFDLPCMAQRSAQRPADELLDRSNEVLRQRVLDFVDACGNLRQWPVVSPARADPALVRLVQLARTPTP